MAARIEPAELARAELGEVDADVGAGAEDSVSIRASRTRRTRRSPPPARRAVSRAQPRTVAVRGFDSSARDLEAARRPPK
jgi:hypothetical protein